MATTPSSGHHSQLLNVLIASSACIDATIETHLFSQLRQLTGVTLRTVGDVEQEVAFVCEWADVAIIGPLSADDLAKMLQGQADNWLLEILRSWPVCKRILLIPAMSTLMWENPMTKKQLAKIRKKWIWVTALQPMLWSFQGGQKIVQTLQPATEDLLEAVRSQIDLLNIGQGHQVSSTSRTGISPAESCGSCTAKTVPRLPPELWTMILDYAGDWELAQHLDVHTHLPVPAKWVSHASAQGPRNYMETLELKILHGRITDIKTFITAHPVPTRLSNLAISVVLKFSMTEFLGFLESQHHRLFWESFGHTILPDKASSVFGHIELLEFWRTSPSFLKKEYNTVALDGASRAGFVHILEWWRRSGLPLKFTQAALEEPSSRGDLRTLEWWKDLSTAPVGSDEAEPTQLKPGKSIIEATKNGHADAVRWWCRSGIPFRHEEAITKFASTHGHVDILDLWYGLSGSKIIDNQVLVSATKHGHVDVLEWWKCSGLRVGYKTCDIEEALEDSNAGPRAQAVRRWWALNGLNLGIGTSEWMKTKYLN
ncbi:hypothetical protein K470DRAFT_300723 [Piedraia hortae CBS 480.64]|uniref:Flavoprotein domain-containing protein n=1 Tax=Piedraia hortae CBS 480.64 TaxID=1314780 RepID=A0A6A7BVB6_9PEZI|nr:hypothetical protein K470DRAFT_300723 [Piedraia hortae CBS 480.64]